MMAALHREFWTGPRLCGLMISLVVIAVFIGANIHLITVSFTSSPDCVLQPSTEGAAFLRAAKPSC